MVSKSSEVMSWLKTSPYCLRSFHLSNDLETRISAFRDSLQKGNGPNKYSDESVLLINYTLDFLRLHDANWIVEKRRRKFDKTPYSTHPLEMAEKAFQLGLDPTIVVACLIHDIAEDVKFGLIQDPQKWIEFFESAYEGYEDKDRLIRILRAETKTETLAEKFPNQEERKQVVDYYMDSPIGRIATKYLQDLRDDSELEPTPKNREHIAEVIFDLNRLFTQSFVEKQNGEKVFDPSVLIVKILDTWQNLKTPGFWRDQLADENKDSRTVAKLIRARILTNVAEFLGMREVASDMTKALSTVQDIDALNFPMLRNIIKNDPNTTEDVYLTRQQVLTRQMEIAVAHKAKVGPMINFAGPPEMIEVGFQMPWGERRIGSSDKSELFANEREFKGGLIVYHVPSNPNNPSMITSHGNHSYHISHKLTIEDGVLRPAILTLLGRETDDYKLSDQSLWPSHPIRVRIQNSSAPTFLSTQSAQEFNPANPQEVPERNIFHPDVCKYMGPIDGSNYGPSHLEGVVDPRLMGLVYFMLSPHTFITNSTSESDVPYVIFVRNKNKIDGYRMYLATNRTDVSLWDIARYGGICNPIVRSLESENSHVVDKDDHHVLDKMRKNGEIRRYNIVIVEEQNEEYMSNK